jgi:methylmalonyl-CoA mutase
MSLKETKNHSFPIQTLANWKVSIEEILKGKSIDSLKTNTYENIQLKPLYTREDLEGREIEQYPGSLDGRRGASPLGLANEQWKVAQTIYSKDPKELKQRLFSSFQKGQTAISFKPNQKLISQLSELLDSIYTKYPFAINAEEFQDDMLATLFTLKAQYEIKGFIAKDPISLYAKTGNTIEVDKQAYDRWCHSILQASTTLPKVRTIMIHTTTYHNGGANAVQELAIAMASAVNHIEELKKRGMTVKEIFSKIVFHFSIGSQFFMEVAKLRAARVLWSKMGEAYEVNQGVEMVISAETSHYTKTAYDPYVNLLRSGNEAFAAVLGGIQYLHVSPYNSLEGDDTEFSDRIARNTQLILMEEAHLNKVIDPVGGSWYIESITNKLIERAWALFLDIEANGGMVEALNSNFIQNQIEAVNQKRKEDIFTRKQIMVGVNQYVNLADKPLRVQDQTLNSNGSPSQFKLIKNERLAMPFERLREKAKQLASNEQSPNVGIVCLGDLKEYKPRADFIEGFLAPGGIGVEKSSGVDSVEKALAFILSTKKNLYFLCGTDQVYENIGLLVAQKLKEIHPSIQLFLVGLCEETIQAEWKKRGLRGFISQNSNCYETLMSFLSGMEAGN